MVQNVMFVASMDKISHEWKTHKPKHTTEVLTCLVLLHPIILFRAKAGRDVTPLIRYPEPRCGQLSVYFNHLNEVHLVIRVHLCRRVCLTYILRKGVCFLSKQWNSLLMRQQKDRVLHRDCTQKWSFFLWWTVFVTETLHSFFILESVILHQYIYFLAEWRIILVFSCFGGKLTSFLRVPAFSLLRLLSEYAAPGQHLLPAGRPERTNRVTQEYWIAQAYFDVQHLNYYVARRTQARIWSWVE